MGDGDYFEGIKEVATKRIQDDSTDMTIITVNEYWKEVGRLSAQCGDKAKQGFEWEWGMSEDMETEIETEFSAEFGEEKGPKFGEKVTVKLGYKIGWEEKGKKTAELEFEAPECGEKTVTMMEEFRQIVVKHYTHDGVLMAMLKTVFGGGPGLWTADPDKTKQWDYGLNNFKAVDTIMPNIENCCSRIIEHDKDGKEIETWVRKGKKKEEKDGEKGKGEGQSKQEEGGKKSDNHDGGTEPHNFRSRISFPEFEYIASSYLDAEGRIHIDGVEGNFESFGISVPARSLPKGIRRLAGSKSGRLTFHNGNATRDTASLMRLWDPTEVLQFLEPGTEVRLSEEESQFLREAWQALIMPQAARTLFRLGKIRSIRQLAAMNPDTLHQTLQKKSSDPGFLIPHFSKAQISSFVRKARSAAIME